VLLTGLLLANGGFEPTAKKNNVSPAKPLFRCVSCFHLVLASGKWWSLAYSQEESYSIHKEHPDHFHKYCSLLALQNLLKAHHAEKSLSSAKKKKKKQKQDGRAIIPIFHANQDPLCVQPESFSTIKDFLVGNYLMPLSSKPCTNSSPRIGLPASMVLTGYSCLFIQLIQLMLQ
jgi:hypothetical protein